MREMFTYENIVGRKTSDSHLDLYGSEDLAGERILITGAGGSIGSKIALAISGYKGSHLLATDRDENRLHSLSLDLLGSALFNSQEFQVLDVKDALGVELCVANFQPTIIIHAAALKHLAVLENQPREAYLTNVIGTHNVLKAAVQFNTRKFLNISTDKAANPISILGKSKYIGELLTAKYGDLSEKNFMSVRFGNVFNSRGSVIETFARQLEFNLPVTLTDINVSRYFMKIEEAASLCLSALFLNNSAIYMLDMGEPIKLIEIIEKMKTISGSESEVQLVGLRPGEKLSEELYSKNEVITNTSHPLIKSIKSDFFYSKIPELSLRVANNEDAQHRIDSLIPK